MSITGALIGRPEPFLKRCTRAASIIGAISARPSSIRHAFAVVPPMSNEITSRMAGGRTEEGGGKAAAGGPALQHADRKVRARSPATAGRPPSA